MNKTPIEWTHWSVNPLKMQLPNGALVNVCIHKSEGCRHCYAESIVRHFWKKEWQKAYGDFPGYTPALLKLGTPVLAEEELRAVLRLSDRIAKGKADPNQNKIFWNDMTDEYLDFWPDELLDKIWAVRALTPNLIHQVLTKRAERTFRYFKSFYEVGAHERGISACLWADALTEFTIDVGAVLQHIPVGLPNVHLGVSCEDQKTADERIPWLLKTPAAVRWISYEPALGPLDLAEAHAKGALAIAKDKSIAVATLPKIDWLVCGGESGPGARPFNTQWARDIIKQCEAAGVPCFVKQLGAKPYDQPKDAFGRVAASYSYHLKDKKGGEMSEWPSDIRVREYPA